MSSDPRPAPRPGDLIDLDVSDLAAVGRGVGRTAGGLVVICSGGVPGDRLRAEVIRMKSSFAEAEVKEILAPSLERVEPRCAHFSSCGGCALQELAPAAQRRVKAGRLRELLRRTGGLTGIEVGEAVSVGPDYGYRDRIELAISGAPGRLAIGYHDREGQVFEVKECPIAHPDVIAAALKVSEALQRAAAEAAGRSLSGRLDVRRSSLTGATLATLRVDRPIPDAARRALAALEGTDGAPSSILLTWGQDAAPRPPRERGTTSVVYGPPVIEEEVVGIRFPLSGDFFVQTQAAGAAAIYRDALEWLEEGTGPLLDLYAGAGLLALAADERLHPATTVEGNLLAVAAGRRTAEARGRQVNILAGDVLETSRALARRGERFAAAAVNPPRAGLHSGLPALLAAIGVERLAYISCDPATLARDLGRLAGSGFRCVRVTPYDLFPQTAGLEAVARLQARAAH
jgi:23S rRNA (uracil1939-C5)-methyltransferase